MRASASAADVLADTSVAIALVVADHDHHRATVEAIGGRRAGLAGHAAFETYSVLTRLPAPLRRTPQAIDRLLSTSFSGSHFLSPAGANELFRRLAQLGIAGASVYDALVGAAATEHKITLATRDRRAMDVYRALEVDVEFLG
jgi:predicted nucleic acid-binding protein